MATPARGGGGAGGGLGGTPTRGRRDLDLNNIAKGCHQTHIECILSVQYSKRLLPVKFNVLKGSVNLPFVMIAFISRSAKGQILYLFPPPPPDFCIFRRAKKRQKPEVSKNRHRLWRWGLLKGGLFWREKNLIWSQTVAVYSKKGLQKAMRL